MIYIIPLRSNPIQMVIILASPLAVGNLCIEQGLIYLVLHFFACSKIRFFYNASLFRSGTSMFWALVEAAIFKLIGSNRASLSYLTMFFEPSGLFSGRGVGSKQTSISYFNKVNDKLAMVSCFRNDTQSQL